MLVNIIPFVLPGHSVPAGIHAFQDNHARVTVSPRIRADQDNDVCAARPTY